MLKQGEQHIMQFMQMLKASLKPRRSLFASLVMVGVVASVMGLAPTHGASNTLAQDCANPPSVPTFNYWPVTFDDDNTPFCHDFPAIDATLDTPNPQWSQSEADWADGLTMDIGQQGAAGIYIHNGAANNLDPEQTMARDVKIITETDTTVGKTHQIKVTFTASNADSYTKSFTVHTPDNSKLEVIPNSGYMYDYEGRVILDQQKLNLGNSTFDLGELDACFEYSLFLTYKFKVVKVVTEEEKPEISIKKSVKNISTDTSYDNDLVQARTGERVKFKVTVFNNGDTTLQNVRMTDRLPEGLEFDDSVSGDGLPSYNTPTFSVDFGSIAAGKSKTVEFAAKVLATGDKTICNIAKATAKDVNSVEDKACVKIFTTPKPGAPNIVLSKRAFNNTKNVDATTVDADRGDYITYSLVTTNTGTADQVNYVIRDDLSQVLPLADMVSTNGGSVYGNVISYPATTIKPGETVVKTFKVRVKQTLDKNLSYQLKNTYGNTIIIKVPGKKVYEAPKTGAAGASAAGFASLVTAGFVLVRNRKSLLKFLLA